jgi:hypothetical protein
MSYVNAFQSLSEFGEAAFEEQAWALALAAKCC